MGTTDRSSGKRSNWDLGAKHGFAVIGLLLPNPCPTEITYIYNTILNFIWVSFCIAYIIVTFRVRIRVRVSFRVRVKVRVQVRDR